MGGAGGQEISARSRHGSREKIEIKLLYVDYSTTTSSFLSSRARERPRVAITRERKRAGAAETLGLSWAYTGGLPSPHRVAGEGGDLRHARVAPDDDLV